MVLYEFVQIVCEMLQYIVDLVVVVEYGVGEVVQEGVFVVVQFVGKVVCQYCFQCGIELGVLFGVVEQLLEGLEIVFGIIVVDYIYVFEQFGEYVVMFVFIVDDVFVEFVVEVFEIIVDVVEVFGEIVGQVDDLVCMFQCVFVVQGYYLVFIYLCDFCIDVVVFVVQC